MCAADLVPVFFVFACVYQVVEVFVFSRFLEREYAYHDYEQYHAYREYIYLLTIIFVAKLYFWCHVSQGSSLRLEHAFLLSGKAEISKLYRQIFREQYVLQFEVTVHDILIMHVLQNVNYLVQEKSADVLAHWPVLFTQIEKRAARNILHHQVHEILYFIS